MKHRNSPDNFSDIDKSSSKNQWIEFMLDWDKIPSIIMQRKILMEIIKNKNNHIKDVLVAGCGPGSIIPELLNSCKQKTQFKANAIDISQSMLNFAQQKYTDISNFIQGDLHTLPFKENTFDLIWVERVLHHIKEANIAFTELSKSLKKNGLLIISEPYIPSTFISQMCTKSTFDFANSWSKTVAQGTIGLDAYHQIKKAKLSIKHLFMSSVIINSYARISKFIDLTLFLKKSGLSEDDIALQIKKWKKADDEGNFLMSFPMYNYVIKK